MLIVSHDSPKKQLRMTFERDCVVVFRKLTMLANRREGWTGEKGEGRASWRSWAGQKSGRRVVARSDGESQEGQISQVPRLALSLRRHPLLKSVNAAA